jgi:hypothetical protein
VFVLFVQEAIGRKRRRIQEGGALAVDGDGNPLAEDGDEDMGPDGEGEPAVRVQLDRYDGPLAEWIALETTRAEIKKQFRTFLLEFKGQRIFATSGSHLLVLA